MSPAEIATATAAAMWAEDRAAQGLGMRLERVAPGAAVLSMPVVERMVNGIARQLESQGEGDIPTQRIGALVLEGLRGLDDVAYVRFASVYRDFRDAQDFTAILGEITRAEEPPGESK